MNRTTRRMATQQRAALTLVEIVVSVAILGSMGVLTLQGITALHRSHMDTVDAARAELLARDLMHEILLQKYTRSTDDVIAESDPVDRSGFIAITDYDGWNSAGDRAVQKKDGTPLVVGIGWIRQCSVTNVENVNIHLDSVVDTKIRKITVHVSRFGKNLKSLVSIRSSNWKSAQTLD